MLGARHRHKGQVQVGVVLTNHVGGPVIADLEQADRRPRIRVSVGVRPGSGEIRVKQFGLMSMQSLATVVKTDIDVPVAPSQVPTVLGHYLIEELPEPPVHDEGFVVGYVLAEFEVGADCRQIISASAVPLPRPNIEQPVVFGAREWLELARGTEHKVEVEGRIVRVSLRGDNRQVFGIAAPLAKWFDCIEIRGGAKSVASITLPWEGADVDLRGSGLIGIAVERPLISVERAMGATLSGESPPPLVRVPPSVKTVSVTDARLKLSTAGDLSRVRLNSADIEMDSPAPRSPSSAARGELDYEPPGEDDFVGSNVRLLDLSGDCRLGGAWRVQDLQLPGSQEQKECPRIEADGELSVRRVLASRDEDSILSQPVTLELGGDACAEIDWVAPGSAITARGSLMLGAGVAFRYGTSHPWHVRTRSGAWTSTLTATADDLWTIRDLRVIGGADLRVCGRVHGLTLPEADGEVARLSVDGRASIDLARGDAAVTMQPGSEIVGDPSSPLKVHSIRGWAGARVDLVDVTRLPLADLEGAEAASSFSVGAPARIGKRPPFRPTDPTTGMEPSAPFESRRDVRWITERFLHRLAVLSRSCAMPAATVREVEFRHYQARRRALGWGRERALLTLFAGLGYGRRVVRPLVAFLVVACIMGLVLTIDSNRAATSTTTAPTLEGVTSVRLWWETTRSALMEPLVLLRLVKPEDAIDPKDGLGTLVAAFLRATGVAMLGFSLVALKRLYSYRDDKTS